MSGSRKEERRKGRFAYEGLDRLIHERARLSVLTSLIAHPKGLRFNDLKQLCALSDGNLHLYTDLPLLLVAGGVNGIKGGQHIRYPLRTPMSNLLLTMLDKANVPHVDKLGDSTGRLDLGGAVRSATL